ncbi:MULTISPECIES: DUF397 domain-containing protein [unclassified Saccharopolyspora]|uniref:DUF397 domain-containing protein n=1 Tax=unclassified Saccharopolyspora TaxID=2646250 RepID=UPI001CD584F1|nr:MULTISPECIES: DUF397 domain-containing protein [unclassified Saccharopolyspora]MCA1228688.1 DUF397 domain-containing protein [Saccharopolyspora sp. 6M]MCA1282658.1 DUF397 domain-containing protein [Saccharopolyspora sp. 7B]
MHQHPTWRKSSRSNANGGACVEVALSADSTAVRDSKLGPGSPVLAFGTDAFDAFLGAVKSGRLDR